MQQKQARKLINTMSPFLENNAAALRDSLGSTFAQMRKLSEMVEPDEETRECLAALRRDLYRILRLAWNLSDLSRIGVETPLLTWETSACAMVEYIYDETEPLLREMGLYMRLQTEKTPPLALNLHYTRRILYQLLSNAIAVSPKDGTVTLSCRHSGQKVLISVTDEGGGIPPEKMANIFSDPLTPEKEFVPHGLRLGLPLAKGLTELQGGNLLAENTETGVRFTLAFPVGGEIPKKKLSANDFDLTGGFPQGLVELSDVLHVEAYFPEEDCF